MSEPSSEPPLESTAFLLGQVREGDAAAEERLFRRFFPLLRKLARRLLPCSGRDIDDTEDLVMQTLQRGLRQVRQGKFEARGEGAFLAYLRKILHNAVIDQGKKKMRKPVRDELSTDIPDPAPSPLSRAIGRQHLERFEAALARLPERKRQAVILRIEFDYSYEQIAEAAGFPTASAARMQVARSLVQIAELLHER
jgi:RNA polymerase sigma-70 factor (ECF subfamily)